MINNYNSLGSGRDTWPKNDVGEVFGSPPNSPNKALTNSWLSCIMMMLLFLLGLSSFAQTTLIDATGNGGFETGATFAANNWTAINSSTDTWNLGTTPGGTSGARCGFISATGGSAWTYSQTSVVQHLYYDVTLPAGQSLATLTFKWKAGGEGTTTSDWDNMKVFWGTTAAIGVPVANTSLLAANQVSGAGAISGMYKLSSTAFNSETIGLAGVPGTTYRLVFSWKSDISDIANPPCAIDDVNLVSSAPGNITAVQGGLWSSPATWGGVVPGSGNDVTIPAGVIVTVNQALSYRDLTVNGTLQWGAGTFSGTFSGNVVINPTGVFLPYSTTLGLQTITVSGNLQNDGYANFALSQLTFTGSGSTLSGSGVFQGDGTRGIIRGFTFNTTGASAVTTSQNLVTPFGLAHTAGSLNTNGKVAIDNTAQLYGQPLNLQVANLVVTNMGAGYSVAPVVFGAAVTQWTSITGVVGTLYVSGSNVYRCTTAASLGATAPVHTSGITNNLLWIGTTGTLGNPFQFTAVTLGSQYFYGGNLYTCTVAGTPASAAPPVHLSGTAVSGTATFRYVGTPATATVNYDAISQTVRSLNLTSAGSGYSSAPSVAFGLGVAGGTGSGAAAVATYIQSVVGFANSQLQKSGGASTISGGLTINSDQGTSVATSNPQASSGVGTISSPSGGNNYTVAPTVGFTLPTALNLVVNTGSGYATAPTITVTGGNLVAGSVLTSANFTITVNNGTIESVYLTGGTGVYSTLPTLAFSAGSATLAFPAGCLPTATAVIANNGQITNYAVTNPGFGYVAAPTVGLGATSGTANGGTFTTAVGTPTARIALYNLVLNTFLPLTIANAAVNTDDAAIPANRKVNVLTLAGNGSGLNLTGPLTIFGSAAPLGLTANATPNGNVLNMGGNNLNFTWNSYTGTFSTFGATNAYVKNGSITMNSRGGNTTLNFPFAGQFAWNSGTTPTLASSGSSVTKVTVSETAAPTNASVGTGLAIGTKAYNVQFGTIGTPSSNPVTGTNPTVSLSFNSLDALTGTQDQLFVAESTALSGAWNLRSTAFGASGALPTIGSKATATAAPGPITPTMSSYYAFSGAAPTITSVLPLTVCANSGTFTVTGTNLTGVTAVSIGGTPVTSFVVVNATTITGVAGNGTNGAVSVVKSGSTVTGLDLLTITPSPSAPSVTPASASINLGGTVNFTASGGAGTFNWYNVASGGVPVFTGANYNQPACTNLWVSENNGSCDGARTLVTVNVAPTVTATSVPFFCGTGSTTTLSVSPADPNITYTWTSLTPSATLATTVGSSVSATLTQTSNFQVVATTAAGCTTTNFVSVGVYPLPSATVTTTASGVCPGTSATIGSGLVAGSFSSVSIPHAPLTAPANAITLVSAGVPTPTPDVNPTGTLLDDQGWSNIPIGFNFNFFGVNYSTMTIGTNGTVFLGTATAAQVSDFTFTTLPSTTEPFNMVAVLAMDNDLRTATGGTIKYWTEGYAPNRKFVVSYENVQEFGDSKFSSAQAVFYETTGVIEPYITSSTNVDRVKLVGVNNGTGTIGVLAYNSGTVASATNPIATPFGFRFTPPANYNTVWSKTDSTGTSIVPTAAQNVFSLTVTPTETTTYSIAYTNTTTGCSNAPGSAQVTMAVLGTVAPVGVNTLAATNPVCLGNTTALSLSYAGLVDGIVFQWQQSTNGGLNFTDIAAANEVTYLASPTAETQYRVSMISCGGTPSFSAPVTITFTNSILTTTPATRCGTGAITLAATANSGANVVWYAAASGGTALFTGATYVVPSVNATTTFYAAAETNGPLCSSARIPVVATVTPAPALLLSASTATICAGASSAPITISGATSYNTYSWSPAIGVSGDQVAGWVFNPASSTIYTLTASETSGQQCITTATVSVTVNSVALSTTSSANAVCLGTPVNLAAQSVGSGSSGLPGVYCVPSSLGGAIITNVTFGTINNTVAQTTPFVNIYPSTGATTTVVNKGQVVPISITADAPAIVSVWIDYDRNGTYDTSEWTQPFTNATSGTVNITIPATATSGQTGMRVRSRGATFANGDSDACTTLGSGSTQDYTISIQQDITNSLTYAWASVPTGFTATTANVTVTPTATTVYTVTATNPVTGCSNTSSKTVIVNTDPIVNITSPSTTMCIGGATLPFTTPTAVTGWTSSNTAVATIDNATGVVTAVSVGTTIINAQIVNTITGCTTVANNPQTVTVYAPVAIVTQPAVATNILVGDNATLSIAASGSIVSYKWRYSVNSGISFSDVPSNATYSNVTSNTLTITNAAALLNGYLYYCEVTGFSPCTSPVDSANAILNVQSITVTDPASVSLCTSGSGSTTFTVTSAGPPADDIVWELFDTVSNDWTVLDAAAVGTFGSLSWTGATTLSLTLNGITLANNGYKVRVSASINDPFTLVTSNEATLTVNAPAVVTVAPQNQTVCYSGGTSNFTSTATGGLGYQWQYSTDNSNWNSVADNTPAGTTYTNATTGTLSIATTGATPAVGSKYYRVLVTSAGVCSSVPSSSAQLFINTPVVTANASLPFICNPGVTPVTLTATGAATYAWSPAATLSASTGAVVTANPTVTTTYTVTGTDALGCSISATVTVLVGNPVAATVTATPATVCPGTNSQLLAAVPILTNTVDNYTFARSSAPYTALVGGTQFQADFSDLDDGFTPLKTIGFNFPYEGNNFSDFSVSSNGYLRLGAVVSGTDYSAIDGADSNVIAFNNRDFNNVGAVYSYLVTGTAPNRICKIEAKNFYKYNTSTETGNAQVWLYETSGKVEIRYGAYASTWTLGFGTGATQIGLSGAGSARTISGTTIAGITNASVGVSATAVVTQATTNQFVSGTVFGFTPPIISTYTYAWSPSTYIAGQETLADPIATNVTSDITYTVVVTSNIGCTNTYTTSLSVQSGVAITTQPANVTSCQGTIANFSAVAAGSGLTYQWRKNGVNIVGNASATSASLALPNVSTADNGSYDVVITPLCGLGATSTAATLTVNPTPVLSTTLTALSVCVGGATTAVPLTGTPTGVTFNISGGAAIGLANVTNVTAIPAFATIAGTATISITPVANGCLGVASTVVYTINALPNVFNVTPTTAVSCSNAPAIQINAVEVLPTTTNIGGCLDGTLGLFGTGTSTTCNGLTSTLISTLSYAGEYSNVTINSNSKYVFTSSVATDYVTISNSTNTTILAAGPAPLTWYSGANTGTVRYWLYADANCGEQSSSRTKAFVCGPTQSFTFAPTTGLFTDAAGTVAYTGTAVKTVYAKPASTTTYTATATSVAGCTRTATTTITAGVATTWFVDADGDAYGNSALPTVQSCSQPVGYAAVGGDCVDNNALINPGRPEILYNGIDDNCNNDIDEGNKLITQVRASQCATTLSFINETIYADINANASSYRFKVVDTAPGGLTQIIDRPLHWFNVTQLPNYSYGKTYSISVEMQRKGIWLGYYGTACNVSTPAVSGGTGVVNLTSTSCNSTLPAINTLIYANSLPGVTLYRFRVTNNFTGVTQVIDRSFANFGLFMLPMGVNYGLSYTVEVAVRINNVFTPYGSACTVSTPAVPTLTNCGTVAANKNTLFTCPTLSGVTQYRFQVSDATTTQIVDRNFPSFSFAMLPSGFTVNTVYTVKVAVKTTGGFSELSIPTCSITSPATIARGDFATGSDGAIDIDQLFKVTAFPNPFEYSFGLNFDSSADSKVTIQIYDMIGKLLESKEVQANDVYNQAMGDSYPSGVYNVIVSQGENVKTLRVIKK